MHLHAVRLRHCADVCGGSNGTGDGRLLLVVRKALACKVRASTLRDLDDDGSLDVTGGVVVSIEKQDTVNIASAYRAASRTALAVDDEVTFWMSQSVSSA